MHGFTAQGLDEGGEVFGVGNEQVLKAQAAAHQKANCEGKDVEEGQGAEHDNWLPAVWPLRQGWGQKGTGLLNVGHQVGMGEHGAFGKARGTAGVLQHGQVHWLLAGAAQCERPGHAHHGTPVDHSHVTQVCLGNLSLHVPNHGRDHPAFGAHGIAHCGSNHNLDIGLGKGRCKPLKEVLEHDQGGCTGILELMA